MESAIAGPMSVAEAIHRRRANRSYTPATVDRSTILAPWNRAATAHEQALDPVARARERHPGELLSDPDFQIVYDAGTLIVICARPASHLVEADSWLAAENPMLLACALGLGTCPIGFAIPALNSPEGKAELGIPTDQTAVAPIIVGFPRGVVEVVERKPPEILSWR
jgi:nitroreductase